MSKLPRINDVEVLGTTRGAWHTLAEHVVSPARYRVTGRIGLRATPGGFGTPIFGDDERVRVDGTELAVARGDATSISDITTVAAAAAAVGIPPGAAGDVYTPTTPLDPDALLAVEPAATEVLAAWFELGAGVLEEIRAGGTDDDDPSLVQLWPEHFDVGLEIGDANRHGRGTFGASPGDATHPEPYLYVTRWPDVPDDPFWDDPTFAGASVGYGDLAESGDVHAAALAFFTRARAVLGGAG